MTTFGTYLLAALRKRLSPTSTPESSPSSSPRTSLSSPRSSPGSPCIATAAAKRRDGYVTLHLSPTLYTWVAARAAEHNYGSVHKSIRDLLHWAADSKPDDLDWIFLTSHTPLPPVTPSAPSTALQARLGSRLTAWVRACVARYRLDSPGELLDIVCRCAVELDAAYDIFESVEAGHSLPSQSADLYYDLGICGFFSPGRVNLPTQAVAASAL